MAEETGIWDDIEDAELLRAILELLATGEVQLPVCTRCLRLLGAPDTENSPEGGGGAQTTW